jgi:glucose/arabinose dehydrogenase
MRGRVTFVPAFALVLAAALAITASPALADIGAKEVAGGLEQPVGFTFGPGNQIWYVEKATGQIRVVDLDTDHDRLFATVNGVNSDGERGMLGVALHPRYPDKPFVYVYVTRTANGNLRNQILRYQDRNGSGVRRRVIFTSPASSSPYHNGGRILFGPDGMLYAIVGEGHDPGHAQDLSDNDRGKILRMSPNGGAPASNPFDNRIWAFGIRNGFGLAFDAETLALWDTDNGPGCNDEVNLIVEAGNYGWGPSQTCGGSSPGNTNADGPDPILPESLYEGTIGITGIAFCYGCGLGSRSDAAMFHGAVNNGQVTRMFLNAQRDDVTARRVVYDHPDGTLSFEVGPHGKIYFSDFDGIYRLVQR